MMRARRAVPLVALLVLALTGCGTASVESAPQPATSLPAPEISVPAPTPSVEIPVAPATPAPAAVVPAPVRVSVADAGIDVPVIPVGVDANQAMELPEDPAVAGWYRFGPGPQSPEGRTVVSAHVDMPGYGIGPFSRIRDLAQGTLIEVTDDTGNITRYRLDSVTYYKKADLPVDDLFARSGSPMLVLITCGGPFDASIGRYEDNVVALATPVQE